MSYNRHELELIHGFLVNRYHEVLVTSEDIEGEYEVNPSGTNRMYRTHCEVVASYLDDLVQRVDRAINRQPP